MEQFVEYVLLRLDACNTFTRQQMEIIRNAVQEVSDMYEMKPKGNQVISYDYLQPDGYKAYFVIKKTEGLSDRTIKQYRHIVDKFLLAVMKPLEEITATDIQLYLYKKQTTDGNNVTSANNIRSYLCSFFGWLYTEHWIPENPTKNIKTIKGLKKAYEPLTAEQFELLMSKMTTQRDRAIVAVLAGSGIRVGEVCTMQLDRLDLTNKRFYVTGKGSKERLCFLTPRAKVELAKYLSERKGDSPYVFVTHKAPHHGISTACVQKAMQTASTLIGFRVHPHKLRHFFADTAHEAGIDVLDISRMLGHESVETTKIYMSENRDDLAIKHTRLR